MAGAWCLPKSLTSKFLEAIRSGEIDPERMATLSSAERRAEFAKILGEDNAREVNAQFEQKLLIKDQQRGLVTWAKKLGGLTEPARRDIIAQISRLDRVLAPDEEQSFLEDLAAKKLGVTVTSQEAKEVFDLAQAAERLKTETTASGWNRDDIRYGKAVQALIEKINSLKPHDTSLSSKAFAIYNIPREAQTSIFHWSAPFVQGWGSISTRAWWEGVGKMFQYFASEDKYRDLEAYMLGHPLYDVAKGAKLGLTNLGDRLTQGEEGVQTHLLSDANEWLGQKTGVPNLIRAWQRSFVGFLNYVRFENFTNLATAARLRGEDISVGSQASKDIASVVNNFSGRGPLPGAAGASEKSVGILNTIFYSPRKMTATMQMFNPLFYARLTPTARTAAMKQLVGSLLATGAVLTLAKVAGAQVSFDPRDQDFAKINIGGEKLDMTGGNAAYLRLLARLTTGHAISAEGKDEKLGRMGKTLQLVKYVQNKLAPAATIIANGLLGSDAIGRPFSVSQTLSDSLTPIVIHSFIEYAENNPDDAAAFIPSLSAFLGVSLESPLPPMSKAGYDVWGDPSPPYGSPRNWAHDPVNQEANRLGIRLDFPDQKIRGIPLTDAQFEQYVHLSGALAHQRLSELIGRSSFQTASPADQKYAFGQAREKARKDVQTEDFPDIVERGEEASEEAKERREDLVAQ